MRPIKTRRDTEGAQVQIFRTWDTTIPNPPDSTCRVPQVSILGDYPIKASGRERRIIAMAHKINQLMRSHGSEQIKRNEAIDAYDAARILFRSPETDDGSEDRL